VSVVIAAEAAQEVRPLRLGMLGLGFSHPHAFARLLREGALRPAPGRPPAWRQAGITHIWDDDPAAARAFAAEHGATAAESPEAILAAGVDGVLIETRNGERARYALPFLRARVPTFIDKPICTTPEDLQAILAAAHAPGALLYSCSSARYDPAVAALRRLIEAGELGTLLAVRASTSHTIARYLEEPHTWQDDVRLGGGTIVNMGIHGMEPLVALLGPEVESVTCVAEKRHFTTSRSEDTALATLRWRGGVVATLEVYSGSAIGGRSFAACGSAGIVETAEGELRWWGGKRAPEPLPAGPRGYVAQLEAFADAVRTGQKPVPLAETEAVALALFAARRAAAEGRAVSLAELR
jgi:predicted dehydrogenase